MDQIDTIIIIIIIIALRGAIWDFLQCPHCAANLLQHVRSNGPGAIMCKSRACTTSAYYMQHVVLRATQYERTAQLLNLTEFKSLLFELYFIGWTINRWRRGGNWSTRRKLLATSFRKSGVLLKQIKLSNLMIIFSEIFSFRDLSAAFWLYEKDYWMLACIWMFGKYLGSNLAWWYYHCTRLCSLVLVWMTLTFIQGHRECKKGQNSVPVISQSVS